MPVEPRAPVGIMLMQEEGGRRLQGYPATTEEPGDMPVKVFLLRQKLYRKSKQEPTFRGGLPKIAEDRYRESRMREIRLSGLRRGDSIYATTARPRPRA